MQDVKITSPGMTGQGTEIFLGGKRVEETTHIMVSIGIDTKKIIIQKYLTGFECEGKFDVEQIITFPDEPEKQYRLVEVE